MQRVSLPGGWVDYREPEDVPEKLRRRVTVMAPKAAMYANSMAAAGDNVAEYPEGAMEYLLEFQDAIALCLVMGWSWDAPVNSEGLGEIPGSAYDAIRRHGEANVSRLLPNFGVDPDPKAPIAS